MINRKINNYKNERKTRDEIQELVNRLAKMPFASNYGRDFTNHLDLTALSGFICLAVGIDIKPIEAIFYRISKNAIFSDVQSSHVSYCYTANSRVIIILCIPFYTIPFYSGIKQI